MAGPASRQLVDGLIDTAATFARELAAIPGVEVVNEVEYTQVCLSFGSDERTRAVTAQVIEDGEVWMSGSHWRGRDVLRISVSNWSTDAPDIATSVAAITRALARTDSESHTKEKKMVTRLNPYLSFRDNAREAIEFYHSVLGGELALDTFGSSGIPDAPADGVMHSQITTDDGLVLMASDTPPGMPFKEQTTSVSISGDDEAELRGYWEKLSDGASVFAPLEMAPWGDIFGMLTDRFGVTWLVNIAGSHPE